MSADFYTGAGDWYRGSVHNHTFESDGQQSAVDLAQWYQDHAMDFIVVTDHNVVADLSGTEEMDILVIPGAEIMVKWDKTFGMEILSLGIDEVKRKEIAPQEIINDVLEQGGVPFISHPHLSGVNSQLMLELDGLVGIETFNVGAGEAFNRESSCIHWDELMCVGRN
ncbi:MAG: hypothetical protein HRU15_06755, partial [Planctomycetes bacterium]|nr:hypothetical protein [Planctomycetota bacterium]